MQAQKVGYDGVRRLAAWRITLHCRRRQWMKRGRVCWRAGAVLCSLSLPSRYTISQVRRRIPRGAREKLRVLVSMCYRENEKAIGFLMRRVQGLKRPTLSSSFSAEGLAVGVAFGSIGSAPSATLASAWGLAVGIAIQVGDCRC